MYYSNGGSIYSAAMGEIPGLHKLWVSPFVALAIYDIISVEFIFSNSEDISLNV